MLIRHHQVDDVGVEYLVQELDGVAGGVQVDVETKNLLGAPAVVRLHNFPGLVTVVDGLQLEVCPVGVLRCVVAVDVAVL